MKSPASSPVPPSLLVIASVAVFGGFLFGYDTAVINGVTPYLKSRVAIQSRIASLMASRSVRLPLVTETTSVPIARILKTFSFCRRTSSSPM